jgi:hypothetical protein
MYRLFLILILLVSSQASAQSIQINKPVTCDSTLLVFQALLEQAGEKPIWIGKGDGVDTSKTVILANEKTKSWTIIQFDKNMACVLGSGVGSQLIFTGPII